MKNEIFYEKRKIIADIALSHFASDKVKSDIKTYYKKNNSDIYCNFPLLFSDENITAYIDEFSQEYYRKKIAAIRNKSYNILENDIKRDYYEYILSKIIERINEDVRLYERKHRVFHKFHFVFCTDPINTTAEIEEIAANIIEHFDMYRYEIENVVDDIIENIPLSNGRETALTYVFNSVAEVIQEKNENMSELDAIKNNLYDKIISKITFYE